MKLQAGDLVLYPGTSLHKVTPVTRGERIASFFWIQSLLREDAQRRLMFELDVSIRRLTQDVPEHPALVQLTGVYHNLLRRWAETVSPTRASAADADIAARQQRRGFWLRTLHQWHWISSAVCLIAMLLFAVTGITLNHAGAIEAKPQTLNRNVEHAAVAC